jgi:hypothetical protein
LMHRILRSNASIVPSSVIVGWFDPEGPDALPARSCWVGTWADSSSSSRRRTNGFSRTKKAKIFWDKSEEFSERCTA